MCAAVVVVVVVVMFHTCLSTLVCDVPACHVMSCDVMSSRCSLAPSLRWLDILHLSIVDVATRPENAMLRRALVRHTANNTSTTASQHSSTSQRIHFTSHGITPYHNTSHCITLHHITSHHMASRYITYQLPSHHVFITLPLPLSVLCCWLCLLSLCVMFLVCCVVLMCILIECALLAASVLR